MNSASGKNIKYTVKYSKYLMLECKEDLYKYPPSIL